MTIPDISALAHPSGSARTLRHPRHRSASGTLANGQRHRAAVDASEPAIERRSARVFSSWSSSPSQASIPLDRELAACAAVLHDIGFSWSDDRAKRCLDAIELHHRLTSQWTWGRSRAPPASDLADASRGVVTFGLDRSWLRSFVPSDRAFSLSWSRHSLRGALPDPRIHRHLDQCAAARDPL